jgi:hypothetical protein
MVEVVSHPVEDIQLHQSLTVFQKRPQRALILELSITQVEMPILIPPQPQKIGQNRPRSRFLPSPAEDAAGFIASATISPSVHDVVAGTGGMWLPWTVVHEADGLGLGQFVKVALD